MYAKEDLVRKIMTPVLFSAALVGLGAVIGCGGGVDESSSAQRALADGEGDDPRLRTCHLDDGTVERDARVHACDGADKKKTTICHVPPGNPANAHTLCIGNAAVPAHLRHHPDYLGPCHDERPCGPSGAGGGGGAGSGGAGGAGNGAGGNGGTPETPPTLIP